MSTELIDDRVSLDQCKRAIEALHAHQKTKDAALEDTELLGAKEPAVWLNVAVKKIPAQQKLMPVRIPIKHPLVDPRTTGVCLITKDPQREYKDLLEAKGVKFVSKVIGISKLKGKFKPFEARRILLKEHGMFLADDRVIPLLPKLLGGKWFDAKKQPIPVTLTRQDLKKELEHAISSSYMNQNRGTNTSIKIGTMSQTPAQILANLQTALPVIGAKISGGWANVQALSIKTNASVSLPIWNCSLEVEDRFAEIKISGEKEKKSEEKKRKREEADKTAEPQPTPEKKQKKAPAVESPAPAPKEKKGKKAAATPESTAQAVESAPKEKKSKKAAAASPAKTTTESPAPKEKKKSKKAAVVETPMEVDEEEEEAPPPRKKSKKVLAAEAAAAAPVAEEEKAEKKKAPKSAAAPASPAVEKTEKKKAPKSPAPAAEKKAPASPAVEKKKAPKSAAPSAEELKAKKAAAPGEKKKEKVAKGGKAGKSAKEGVIGKKGLSR